MVDKVTEAEWKKSKRIEAERMKAAQALKTDKANKEGLAYLDPQKARGFSRSPQVILASAEKMANASIIFAVLGIVFGIFSSVASMVVMVNNLGLAGAALLMVIGGINVIGLGVATLTALLALVPAIVVAVRYGGRAKPIIISSTCTLALVVIYCVTWYLITQNMI